MIPIDEAGFIEGDFFAPIGSADAQVRLVTVDGDGSTGAVLGHVSALVYLRMDQSSLCPDVPPPAVTGCAIPDGVLFGQSWGEFADYAAWSAWVAAQPFDTADTWTGTYGTALDDTMTFNGEQSLLVSPLWSDYFITGTYDFGASEAPDKTLMMRFYMDAFVHNGAGVRDGYIIAAPYTNGQYLNLIVNDGDRLKMNWRESLGPTTYAEADIGPSSVLFDQDRELIMRCWIIDAANIGVRVYVHAPCDTPELLYEKLDVPNFEGAADFVWDFEFLWNVSSGIVLPTGDLWLYQVALDDDPTVFGIPL